MTAAVAGIDPHQDTFTVGIVDHNGVELATATFANRGSGFLEALDCLLLTVSNESESKVRPVGVNMSRSRS